jgi:asparagine synthase (glutamine-hydrolysing)
MCGIAGYINLSTNNLDNESIIHSMLHAIKHRGPDDYGSWIGDRIVLGHRRLSILDLSPSGHQPMLSADARYHIVFNGEIYNHLELRNQLAKEINVQWKGHSDTETLLACFSNWGFVATIKKVIGMFALALYDHADNKLILTRDRIGEKPLYYGKLQCQQNEVFAFVSELSSLKAMPSNQLRLNNTALPLYLRHNYIPAPYSIYEGIQKLMPGTYLEFDLNSGAQKEVAYWQLTEIISNGKKNPFKGSFQDAVEELDKLLGNVVEGQMISDVPLGAFLSGGIDSSTVVSLMQSKASQKVKTFSIGFDIDQFDESAYARQVASHLGTDHTERIVTEKEALELVPSISSFFSEPFADSSQLPTYLVAGIAKEKVTVSLSGDAGDELFGGYNRYLYASGAFQKIRKIPKPLRNALSSVLRTLPPSSWNQLIKFTDYRNIGEKIHKIAKAMHSDDAMELYKQVVSHTDFPTSYLLNAEENFSSIAYNWDACGGCTFTEIEKMMAVDTLTYLPDDILVKVDRASMAVSLESRVPFLDHRVIEFAWSLPLNYKLSNGNGKMILKELLYRYVPKKIMDRPKMGFGIPLSQWLNGPLKGWCLDLLNEDALNKHQVFNTKAVSKLVKEHMDGKADHGYMLWNFLMLQSWLNDNK